MLILRFLYLKYVLQIEICVCVGLLVEKRRNTTVWVYKWDNDSRTMTSTIEIMCCTSDLTLMAFAGFVHYPLMERNPTVWNRNLFAMLLYFSWITVLEGILSILSVVNMSKFAFNSSGVAFVLFWLGILITVLIIYQHCCLSSSWSDQKYTLLWRLNAMRILTWSCRLVLLYNSTNFVAL